jgi:hypothetical protein
MMLPFDVRKLWAQIPGGTLLPRDVPKYVTPLVKPPAMPLSRRRRNGDLYKIAVRQFEQQIVPVGPPTPVWSYGSVDYPGTALEGGTFHYPAFTVEALANRKVSVEWRNELVDAMGNYLPHLLPVDQTLHWCNPPGGKKGRDRRGSDPTPYMGPVPMVTHVHGAHVGEESDGYAEAWWLPDANNIPMGYATTGTFYDYFAKKYNTKWDPGTATFDYPNDQPATTLWYHDHSRFPSSSRTGPSTTTGRSSTRTTGRSSRGWPLRSSRSRSSRTSLVMDWPATCRPSGTRSSSGT